VKVEMMELKRLVSVVKTAVLVRTLSAAVKVVWVDVLQVVEVMRVTKMEVMKVGGGEEDEGGEDGAVESDGCGRVLLS
jgi:hypothetical protein